MVDVRKSFSAPQRLLENSKTLSAGFHSNLCVQKHLEDLHKMPPYVFGRAFSPPFLRVISLHRFAHTQRRTLPDFSLEGKVAVGEWAYRSEAGVVS